MSRAYIFYHGSELLRKLTNKLNIEFYGHDISDYITEKIIKLGWYEFGYYAIWERYLTPESVVIDVGANIGVHAVWFGLHCKKVFAFEPFDQNFAILQKNIAVNNLNNVIAQDVLIGNGEAVTMGLPGKYNSNYGAYMALRDMKTPHQFERKMTALKLDDIINERIDFIKIDVQGMEAQVMLGAEELIKAHRPVVFVEWNKRDFPQLKVGYNWIFEWAKAHKYNNEIVKGGTQCILLTPIKEG